MKFRHGMMLLGTVGMLVHAGTATGAEDIDKLKEKLIAEQCNLCHSSHRIYSIDPAQIAAVVERMRKMNPEWFVDFKSEHMVEAIAAIVKDPAMVATRKAWKDAVDRGELLFSDTSLGKNGFNCKKCHDPSADHPYKLRNITDAFPRWDPKLKRFVDINEAINRMIVQKLDGDQLPPNDQRLFDLIAFLKTLK